MLRLDTPVGEISHIARGVVNQLRHLGVISVHDLLFYFPARYDDLSKITLIKNARIGERIVIRARVELIESQRSRYRHKLLTQAVVSDKTGSVRVTWFNQPWIAKMFKSGDELYLVGEFKDDGAGAYLSSPIYEKVGKGMATHTARIVPIYPATERLSQKQIRFLVKCALPISREVPESLPALIQKEQGLMGIVQALQYIHFPPDQKLLEQARYRFKFGELFRLQLFALSLKRELKKISAPAVNFNEPVTKRFVGELPFELTDDQRRAAWEILGDLGRRTPMNRLLEGEVGSGKTVVVAIAALNAVGVCGQATADGGLATNTGQVAIMAPTGILARQHFGTFAKLFASVDVKIGLMTHESCIMNHETGGMKHELKRSEMLKKIHKSEIDIVIGTHALIQSRVRFKNLVLAVVDEQHRFGVDQRAALRAKREDGAMPHLLSLTATPIPRSLALVFYGDLDVSVLREMPKGRQKVETRIVNTNERPNACEFVREQVRMGHQVFWTCPIIDPSDVLGVKAATEVFEHLRTEVFPDLRVGLLHGRMKSKERERVMGEFAGISGGRTSDPTEVRPHRIDILVATPVIEVGIDVPNATVMVIEGSERFGLAQLHQFRGRVGRGSGKSYCLLMVEDGQEANSRLSAFLECDNGFELAERDLTLRGPGEIYSGTAQSGFPEFKIAAWSDVKIAKAAKESARKLLELDPELTHYPVLKQAVLAQGGQTHLE